MTPNKPTEGKLMQSEVFCNFTNPMVRVANL